MSPGRNAAAPEPLRTSESPVTVLVVDDHQSGLYTKVHVLSRAGFQALEASTGRDALRLVAEQRPALVVLDVRLPDIDGIEVCRAIKADPATSNTMVLQVSAYYTSPEDHVQGLDSGADFYISGEIDPAVLLSAVNALLRTRRAEEALRDRDERLKLTQALDRTEKELRALTATLFTAQEDEQRRIARELHDDFSQRLGLLEMELTELRQHPQQAGERLDRIVERVSALSNDLHQFSRTLHPSTLEHLGLQAALLGLCEEFERSSGIAMNYTSAIGDRKVPPKTATMLYRVAQEGLRNVAKHAGDARVTVTLSANDGELCLTIQDDGCGFDPEAARQSPALGLISMRERARLLGGRIDVRSAPGEGTTITVWAPWPE